MALLLTATPPSAKSGTVVFTIVAVVFGVVVEVGVVVGFVVVADPRVQDDTSVRPSTRTTETIIVPVALSMLRFFIFNPGFPISTLSEPTSNIFVLETNDIPLPSECQHN